MLYIVSSDDEESGALRLDDWWRNPESEQRSGPEFARTNRLDWFRRGFIVVIEAFFGFGAFVFVLFGLRVAFIFAGIVVIFGVVCAIFLLPVTEGWWRRRQYSFEFGNSGNAVLDQFILNKRLKWIPYDRLTNVEYLNKGGFGTIYKATWLDKYRNSEVVLKCPNNLNHNLDEFLNEWKYHERCLKSPEIINLYGFTKNSDMDYMVVMDFANKGNLRGNLENIVKNDWREKLYTLYKIISGLNEVHNQYLIHCDFHDGNILIDGDKVYISDLGLCKSAISSSEKGVICGVVPFIAPEVLRGKPYTQASDIYSFSMIMWEFTSGVPPFSDVAHDFQLSISICRGERPKIIENIPQCYIELMKKCWNEDPFKRPSAPEVKGIIRNWIFRPNNGVINEELKSNIIEFINAPIVQLVTEDHPGAYFTSRLLDFTSVQLNEFMKKDNLNRLDVISESECLSPIVVNSKILKSLDKSEC